MLGRFINEKKNENEKFWANAAEFPVNLVIRGEQNVAE